MRALKILIPLQANKKGIRQICETPTALLVAGAGGRCLLSRADLGVVSVGEEVANAGNVALEHNNDYQKEVEGDDEDGEENEECCSYTHLRRLVSDLAAQSPQRTRTMEVKMQK